MVKSMNFSQASFYQNRKSRDTQMDNKPMLVYEEDGV